MPRSSMIPMRPDPRPERPAHRPGASAPADSNPSPFRWRHLVGWLRKG